MKNNNKKTFNKKRLKLGSYGIILSAIVIALVVMINVVVASLPTTYTHFNTDTVDYFEIGEETENLLDSVKEDVTVYYVAEKGTEDQMIEEMLLKYKAMSSKIKLEEIDPAVYPTFMSKYSEDTELTGGLVFESDKRFKVVTSADIYYTDMSNVSEQEQLYAYLYGIEVGTTYFLGELAFTTAIDYVTRDNLPKMYFLTGHGESAIDSYFTGLIENENIAVSELNLQQSANIPEDCSALVSILPTADYSADVAEKIITYLNNGGDFILVTDTRSYTSDKCPNIEKVANAAGLASITGTLYDKLATTSYGELVPTIVASENRITSLLENTKVNTVFLNAHAIKEIEGGTDAIITPLVKTTSKGEIRVADGKGGMTVLEEYKNGAVLNPAVQSDKATANGKLDDNSTFVWFASSVIVNSQYKSLNNDELFMAAVSYICDNSASYSILGKTSSIEPLLIPENNANLMMLTFTVIIPVAVLGCGFVVWFRRRKL